MKSYFDNIVFLDIKTSNLSSLDGEILEIAAIKFSNGQNYKFHRLIKNEFPIGKTVLSSLPEIKLIDLAKSKNLNYVLDELSIFTKDLPIITYNVEFKKEFLEIAYFKCNRVIKNKFLDLLELIFLLEPYHKESTLKFFTENILCIKFINRALNNTLYLIDICNKILERNNVGDLISIYSLYLKNWNFNQLLEKYHYDFEFMKIKEEPIFIEPEKVIISPLKFSKNCEDTLKDISNFKLFNPRYEFRNSQFNVMKNVRKNLDFGGITLIEAGTGTGKSIAYLLPSLAKSSITKQKIFISTNTKELQRQLTQKDIPFLIKAFNLEKKINFVNIKGKGNYICPDVLSDILKDTIYLENKSTIEKLALVFLDRYSKSGEYGDIEEINYFIKEHFKLDSLLHFCNSDSDGCDIKKCHKKCFYKNTVENLKNSNLVVLNHSLLLKWSYEDEIKNVIIDEAHNLSDSIFDAYASTLSLRDLKKLLLEILDYEKKKGYINYVWKFTKNRTLDFREKLRDKINISFDTLDRIPYISLKNLTLDYDLDITFDENYSNYIEVRHEFLVLKEDLLDIYKFLKKFIDSNNFDDLSIKNRSEILIKKFDRLFEYISFIEVYTSKQETSNCYGYYCSKNKRDFEAYLKDLNSPSIFFEKFLNTTNSCLFLSATLKNKNSYDVFKKSLAIDKSQNKLITEVLDIMSPFNLAKRTIISSPSNCPRYFDDNFIKFMIKTTLNILETIPGNLLILFTSKKRLELFKDKISLFLASKNIKLYFRKRDIDKLQNTTQKSILLGSKGFFEGIDIPGDSLSCVLMDKLPIINPTNPLYSKLIKNGKNFTSINTPKVITDFKQCFGRLIRTELDYGYFIVFDKGNDNFLWSELSREFKSIKFTNENSSTLIENMCKKYLEWNILNMDIVIEKTISSLENFLLKNREAIIGDSLKLINYLNYFYKIELQKRKLNQNIIFKNNNKNLISIYRPLNREILLSNKYLLSKIINKCFK